MKIVAYKSADDTNIVYSFQMTELTALSLFQKHIDIPDQKIDISFPVSLLSSERIKLIHAYVDAVFRQIESNEYLNHTLTYKKLEIAKELAEFYKKYPNSEKIKVYSFYGFVQYGAVFQDSLFFKTRSVSKLGSLKLNNNKENDLDNLLMLYHEAYSLESEGNFTVEIPIIGPLPSFHFYLSDSDNLPKNFEVPGGRLGYILTSLIFDTFEENVNTPIFKWKQKLIKILGNKFEKPENMNQYLFPGYRAASLTPVRNTSSSGAT